MDEVNAKPKWYYRTWFVIISLIVFFPIGLYLMWKGTVFGKKWRIALSIIFGLIFVSNWTGNNETAKNTSPSAPTKQVSAKMDIPAPELLKQATDLKQAKDYQKTKETLALLIEKHPASNEAIQAKSMLTEVDTIITKEREAKEAEQRAKIAAEKAKQEQALAQMRKRHDEIQGVTWYQDRSTTQYNNETDFFIYMGKKEGNPWLRFRIQFEGDSWLFIKKYIIKADDRTFTIVPSYGEVKRDHDSRVWEWYDVNIDKQKYEIVKAIIGSNKTILRCEGDKYYKDRIITPEEKDAMQNVLDAFVALGGNLN